jgi:hypothetical protein
MPHLEELIGVFLPGALFEHFLLTRTEREIERDLLEPLSFQDTKKFCVCARIPREKRAVKW